MSQLLRLLHRSGSARLLLLITLLALTGGTLLTLASLRPHDSEPIDRAAYDRLMSTRVQSLDELLQWFYDQQAQWERIIPPGLDLLLQPGLPDVVVLAPDGKDWPDALRKAFERLKPTWRNSVPTYELDLQEDLKGQITIRDSVGNTLFTVPAPPDYQMPYEALFRQSVSPLLYEPWLNRYKLRARITLLPEAFVEPYLYAQAEIEAFARQQTEPEMQMMMSGGACSEITFTAIELSTNGMDFALCVPEGITNADLFASTNLMPDGFPWVWVATNLQVVTNRVVWSWANLGETNVFFAAGDGATDSDGDGLPDAREFFLYGTGMNAWDSDGDSYSDGEEVQWGTNPLDNQSMPALGRGVVINEVLYDPAGSDAGKEWVELFNTNRVSVDLSGYILQLGSNVFGDVYTFPAGTVLPSGDFLLVGGNLVANADQVVELTMLNRGSTGPTAGVRLLTPSATSNRVVDALLYAPNNTYNLPTTAFGTNGFAPYANSGQALARIKVGYDTDHASDWRYTSSPTPTAQGAAPDLDGDGLSNAAEIVGAMTGYGYRTTDYNLADTDGDTFLDGEERTNSPPTDPRLYDTDGDAFPWAITHGSDGAEVHYAGTDPTNPDSDGDGLPDGWEAALGLDPFDSDSDQNGTSDSDEDTDGDGASNGGRNGPEQQSRGRG